MFYLSLISDLGINDSIITLPEAARLTYSTVEKGNEYAHFRKIIINNDFKNAITVPNNYRCNLMHGQELVKTIFKPLAPSNFILPTVKLDQVQPEPDKELAVSIPSDRISKVHPVWSEENKFFFVANDGTRTLPNVSYSLHDICQRKEHPTDYLAFPLDVPNFLSLCQVPGQIPWDQTFKLFEYIKIESVLVTLTHKETGEIQPNVRLEITKNSKLKYVEWLAGELFFGLNLNPQTNRLNIEVVDTKLNEDNVWDITRFHGIEVYGIVESEHNA